jgi:A/G-specific adenine glycosylase
MFCVPTKEQQFVVTLMRWFAVNQEKDLPWRETTEPWPTLVAAVLLRNTTTKQVKQVYVPFVGLYSSPMALAVERTETLRQILQPLGMSRIKATQLRKMARALVRRYKGRVPDSREALLGLPGVGEYITSEVLSVAFDKDEPMLDRNLERVLARFFSINLRASSTREIWSFATSLVPAGDGREFGYAAIDFAHAICKLRNPLCMSCPLGQWCNFKRSMTS